MTKLVPYSTSEEPEEAATSKDPLKKLVPYESSEESDEDPLSAFTHDHFNKGPIKKAATSEFVKLGLAKLAPHDSDEEAAKLKSPFSEFTQHDSSERPDDEAAMCSAQTDQSGDNLTFPLLEQPSNGCTIPPLDRPEDDPPILSPYRWCNGSTISPPEQARNGPRIPSPPRLAHFKPGSYKFDRAAGKLARFVAKKNPQAAAVAFALANSSRGIRPGCAADFHKMPAGYPGSEAFAAHTVRMLTRLSARVRKDAHRRRRSDAPTPEDGPGLGGPDVDQGPDDGQDGGGPSGSGNNQKGASANRGAKNGSNQGSNVNGAGNGRGGPSADCGPNNGSNHDTNSNGAGNAQGSGSGDGKDIVFDSRPKACGLNWMARAQRYGHVNNAVAGPRNSRSQSKGNGGANRGRSNNSEANRIGNSSGSFRGSGHGSGSGFNHSGDGNAGGSGGGGRGDGGNNDRSYEDRHGIFETRPHFAPKAYPQICNEQKCVYHVTRDLEGYTKSEGPHPDDKWPACVATVFRCQRVEAHVARSPKYTCSSCVVYQHEILEERRPELFERAEERWVRLCGACSARERRLFPGLPPVDTCMCPVSFPTYEWTANGRQFCGACRFNFLKDLADEVDAEKRERIDRAQATSIGMTSVAPHLLQTAGPVIGNADNTCFLCAKQSEGGDVYCCFMCEGIKFW